MKNIAVYPYKADFAKRHDQLSLWRESWQANIQCSHALNSLILRLDHTDTKPGLYQVIADYGPERPMFLIAMTIRNMVREGKSDNLEHRLLAWSKSVYHMGEIRNEYLLRATAEELNRITMIFSEIEVNWDNTGY